MATQEDVVRFPAIRFQQDTQTFYSVCLTGRMLLDDGFAVVDKWTPSNPEGYQRDPSKRRFSKVAEYLRGDLGLPGILPQSVLLGLRGKAVFQSTPTAAGAGSARKPTCEIGTLSIPRKLLPLQEIDGQHRLGGVRAAASDDHAFEDYPVPAVICESSSRMNEALLFYNVNTTTVKVPVDLAQRLIAQQADNPETRDMLTKSGKLWIQKAMKIADILNETPDQPWHNYVIVPGVASDRGVKQNTIARSLQPLLTGDHVYKTLSAEDLATLLIRYWGAIEKVWPATVDPGTRQLYAVMKSVGILSLHGVAPQVFELVRSKNNSKVSEQGLLEAIEAVAKSVPEEFWHSDNEAGQVGTNHKAIRYVSEKILDGLNEAEMASDLL